MIDNRYALGVIVVMALVTFSLRALPFLAARWLEHHPKVQQLGRFLPLAIMSLLLLHSAVGNARSNPHGPWPEIFAVLVTVALQWWGRHALLSILSGTTLYLVLRNTTLLS